MKWRNKPKEVEPKRGDRKRFEHFAILPVRCNDGFVRWLERVSIEYVYVEHANEYAYWAYVPGSGQVTAKNRLRDNQRERIQAERDRIASIEEIGGYQPKIK